MPDQVIVKIVTTSIKAVVGGGPQGIPGTVGSAVWGGITGTLGNQGFPGMAAALLAQGEAAQSVTLATLGKIVSYGYGGAGSFYYQIYE